MQRKGLNFIYGIIATLIALVLMVFGGSILVPLLGEKGVLFVGLPIAAVCVVLTLISGSEFSEVFPFKLPPVKSFFGALLLFIGVSNASNVYSLLLSTFVDIGKRSDSIDAIITKMSPIAAIIVVALLPAICEEFFCRGFLVRCFSAIKSKWLLILTVAAIFGALHLDLVSFVPCALFGGLMCYIALKTNSLLLPMLFHFINNSVSVLAAFSSVNQGDEALTIDELYPLQRIAMAVFYVGIAVLTIYIGYRLISGKKIFTKFLAVSVATGLLLCTVGYALMTVGSMKFIHIKAETIEYSSEINETVPFNITEKGNYMITVTVTSDEEVDVVFCCGDENLKKESGKNYIQLVYNFEYEEGNCFIRITDKTEEELGDGSISINYIVMRINV